MKKRKKRSTFRGRSVGPFKKRSGARCDFRIEDFHRILTKMNESIRRFGCLIAHRLGAVVV